MMTQPQGTTINLDVMHNVLDMMPDVIGNVQQKLVTLASVPQTPEEVLEKLQELTHAKNMSTNLSSSRDLSLRQFEVNIDKCKFFQREGDDFYV